MISEQTKSFIQHCVCKLYYVNSQQIYWNKFCITQFVQGPCILFACRIQLHRPFVISIRFIVARPYRLFEFQTTVPTQIHFKRYSEFTLHSLIILKKHILHVARVSSCCAMVPCIMV